MIEIIPAIMPDSYDDLVQKARKIVGVVPYAQIDVMDGKFVPSKSWPYNEGGGKQFKTMIEKEAVLPFSEEINYEIDLMVADPETVVSDWIALGARRIIIHIESCKKIPEIISLLKERHLTQEDFTSTAPVEFGLALASGVSPEILTPYIHDIDFVQYMGIKKIGYQGESFDDGVLTQIKNLRQTCPHLIMSVDGGVNFDTAPKLIHAGVSRLVSGSTIFNSIDIREAIFKLRQI
ncbi:MAG: hypothetical protein WD509_00960 [Candidatus Paceibacterota bacterium]